MENKLQSEKQKNGGSIYYSDIYTHCIILMAITGPKYEPL